MGLEHRAAVFAGSGNYDVVESKADTKNYEKDWENAG